MLTPTDVFRIERGTEVDDYGDTIDTPTIVAAGIHAAVTTTGRATAPGRRWVTATTTRVRFPRGVDVQPGDRLISTHYDLVVDDVRQATGLMTTSVVATCRGYQ